MRSFGRTQAKVADEENRRSPVESPSDSARRGDPAGKEASEVILLAEGVADGVAAGADFTKPAEPGAAVSSAEFGVASSAIVGQELEDQIKAAQEEALKAEVALANEAELASKRAEARRAEAEARRTALAKQATAAVTKAQEASRHIEATLLVEPAAAEASGDRATLKAAEVAMAEADDAMKNRPTGIEVPAPVIEGFVAYKG